MASVPAWRPVRRLDVTYQDDGAPVAVGTLGLADHGRVAFQYDSAWVARGVELSPQHLGLADVGTRLQLPTGAPLHGLFADALPDTWGERIQRLAFQRLGLSWDAVTPLDQLAAVGTRAIGALSFRPAVALGGTPVGAASFEDLLSTVDALVGGEGAPADGPVLDRLQRVGGTAGGAQPKVLVGLRESDDAIYADPDPPAGFRPYLIKFSPRETAMNLSPAHGAIEVAYVALAKAAGLRVPDARLVRTSDGRTHFAVARFDRTSAGGRRHIHSLAGLLGTPPGDAYDYDGLLAITRALTGRHPDVVEAFARGVFNVLMGNDDDHGRNTAFLLDPQVGWTLAPAYDLVYQPGRGARGMAVLGKERDITRQDFEALAARHDLKPAERDAALTRVVAALQDWPTVAAAHEVPLDWTAEIAATMDQRLGRGFR